MSVRLKTPHGKAEMAGRLSVVRHGPASGQQGPGFLFTSRPVGMSSATAEGRASASPGRSRPRRRETATECEPSWRPHRFSGQRSWQASECPRSSGVQIRCLRARLGFPFDYFPLRGNQRDHSQVSDSNDLDAERPPLNAICPSANPPAHPHVHSPFCCCQRKSERRPTVGTGGRRSATPREGGKQIIPRNGSRAR